MVRLTKRTLEASRSRRWPARSSAAGFTLVELLVVMTVLAGILALLMGALQLNVRAWETGADIVAQNEDRRAISRTLRRIGERSVAAFFLERGRPRFVFHGDNQQLRLVTRLPLGAGPNSDQPVIAWLSLVPEEIAGRGVVSRTLVLDWLPWPGFRGALPERADAHRSVLLDEVTAFAISYLSNDRPSSWLSNWDRADDLPRLLRLTFRTAENLGNSDQTLIVRLPLEAERACFLAQVDAVGLCRRSALQ